MTSQTLGIKIAVEGAAQAGAQMKAVSKNVNDTGAAANKASRMADDLTKQLRRLAGVAVGVMAVREFVQAADAMALLDARLRNTTGAGREFAQAQADIYRISQANNVGLLESTNLYTKLNDPVKRLGGSTRETTGIVDAFATSLRVGGASAQEASSATLQFAQAMASGRLQGDEFRSMAEASPRFMTALADGMGVPIEKLKEMSKEGLLTADVVGNALLKSLGQLKAEAQTLPDTVGGAFTRLKNDALIAAQAFDTMAGTTSSLAEIVGGASSLVRELTGAFKASGDEATDLGSDIDLTTAAIAAMGITMETVVALGANVAFVFNRIAAQFLAVRQANALAATGDLDGAKRVMADLSAQSDQMRARLDAFTDRLIGSTARVLAQRDALKSHGLSAAENANEMARLTGRVGTASTSFTKLKSTIVDTTEANKASAKAAKEAAAAAKAHAELVERTRKAMFERQDAYLESLDKAAESEEAQLQRLRDQYIELTAGKAVLADLVNLRDLERAIALERQADGTGWPEEAAELREIAGLLRQQMAIRKGITEATASQEAAEANKKAAEDAQREWQRTSDQIGQSLADSLMEGGKSAAEYIKGLFRTMILRPVIQAAVQPVANAVLGAIGLGGAGGGSNALGTVSNASSLYNIGSNVYGAGTGYSGLVNSAAGWMGAGSTAGAAAGSLGYANLVGAAGGDAMGAFIAGNASWGGVSAGTGAAAGGSSAAGLGWTGWGAVIAAAVMQGMKDYDQGFTREEAKNTGTVAGYGTYFASELLSSLGVSDKIADIFGATAVAALIGRAAPRITGQGIQGSLGGGEFDGQAYADIYEKGGWFRKGKAYQELKDLPEDLGRFMDDAATGVLDKAKEYGDALGLPVDALGSITKDIKFQIGDDAEANKTAILNALGSYGDALVAGWAEALKPLAVYGETTIQTIERVATGILQVNGVLELLGIAALESSVEGGKAAQALADIFGGLDGLAQASTAYYQAFYTEAEKTANVTRQLNEALTGVGLAAPGTRDEFRALVEGLDLTSQAGREQFAVLMGVAGAFAELNPLIGETTEVLRQRAALELELLRLQGDTAEIRRRELAEIDPSNAALQERIYAIQDEQAAAQLASQAMAAAAASAQQYLDVFNGVMGGLSDSRFDLENQLLALRGKTDEVAQRTRERDIGQLTAGLTAADAAAAVAAYDYNDALRAQVKELEGASQAWGGVAQSAVSAAQDVRSAWDSIFPNIADEIRRLRGIGKTGAESLATVGAEFAVATAAARAGDSDAAARLPGLSRQLDDLAMGSAGSASELAIIRGRTAASLENTLNATGGASSLADLRGDVQKLREDLVAAMAQNASYAQRTAKALERAMPDGDALATRAAT